MHGAAITRERRQTEMHAEEDGDSWFIVVIVSFTIGFLFGMAVAGFFAWWLVQWALDA